MAIDNFTAVQNTAATDKQPTPKFEEFHSDMCGDIFRTQSLLVAARSLLADQVITDDGPGMHLDDVLLEANDKLTTLTDRLNAALNNFS